MSRNKLKREAVIHKGGCCILCGFDKDLAALDFHHINPCDKIKNISDYYSWSEEFEKELDKCVLVCKNCHSSVHSDWFEHDLWEVLEG